MALLPRIYLLLNLHSDGKQRSTGTSASLNTQSASLPHALVYADPGSHSLSRPPPPNPTAMIRSAPLRPVVHTYVSPRFSFRTPKCHHQRARLIIVVAISSADSSREPARERACAEKHSTVWDFATVSRKGTPVSACPPLPVRPSLGPKDWAAGVEQSGDQKTSCWHGSRSLPRSRVRPSPPR